MQRLYDERDKAYATFDLPVPPGTYLIVDTGAKRLVSALHLVVQCVREYVPVDLQSTSYGTTQVAWGAGELGPGAQFTLVATEREGEPGRATLKVAMPAFGEAQLIEMIQQHTDVPPMINIVEVTPDRDKGAVPDRRPE